MVVDQHWKRLDSVAVGQKQAVGQVVCQPRHGSGRCYCVMISRGSSNDGEWPRSRW